MKTKIFRTVKRLKGKIGQEMELKIHIIHNKIIGNKESEWIIWREWILSLCAVKKNERPR